MVDLSIFLAEVRQSFKESTIGAAAIRRNEQQLHRMVLLHLIENFERFLKEVAAESVNCLAEFVVDDRFDAFLIQGSGLAAHFGTDTLGKSLCESIIWLDCDAINKRFRFLLADSFQTGLFYLFPKQGQQPLDEQWRFETLSIIWQLRHTLVHNVGLITRSDAIKLRLLAKRDVKPLRLFTPNSEDLRYIKQFLDETAVRCNQRIGERLAELLTTLYTDNPILFAPKEMADRLSNSFGFVLTVAGVSGTVLP